MTRREWLQLAATVPTVALTARWAAAAQLDLDVRKAPSRVVLADGSIAPSTIQLEREWTGPHCRSRLSNRGSSATPIKEIVLCDLQHTLPSETALYGEGFQMLSQTGGTLGAIVDLGNYTDVKHYKMPEPVGTRVVYNLLTLAVGDDPRRTQHYVLAFTSCRRFSGKFHLRPHAIEVVLDAEGLVLRPGESWELEEFFATVNADRDSVLASVAARLRGHHRPRGTASPPSGWCSWYCFGPNVTAKQVLDNLDVIARDIPGLRYIQIDDGYQPAMGDWLETGKAFGGDVQTVLRQIRKRGFEPAIWVAPFVAEEGSTLFREHPEWFVKDADGQPLRSDRVTFGGWRRGPWYAVDGTHPGAQAHLERVFKTMRDEWGCTYFKLDANFWGAIHGGRFQDPRATRVEAYRRGMAAVLRGTRDAFVLGCNHPIWPSIGVVDGSRSSHDIRRDWKRITETARQNLSRNWQNGRLWWNDPDAIVLTGNLSDDEFQFHASVIFASGGMILSGDDLTTITAPRLAMLKKLQPPTAVAARFADISMRVGHVDLPDRHAVCLLNWTDASQPTSFSLDVTSRVRDLWTDADLGRMTAGRHELTLAPRSGRVLMCTPVESRASSQLTVKELQ